MRIAPVENAHPVQSLAGAGLVLVGLLTNPANHRGPDTWRVLRALCRPDLLKNDLQNASAATFVAPLPPPAEIELDSPNFVASGLREFIASGFVRRNRWS